MGNGFSAGLPADGPESAGSKLDPRIEEALRELTPSRLLEILLVTRPRSSSDPLLTGLALLGHRVVIATSDKQALENFYRQAFDLVICDKNFAGSNCDEFAAYLRTLDPRQRILVLG